MNALDRAGLLCSYGPMSDQTPKVRTTALRRLEYLLDQRDEEIAKLEEEIKKVKHHLRGSFAGWSMPREEGDDGVTPVPRLEFAWTPHEDGDWRNYTVEYRMVTRHLFGHLVLTPLGSTTVAGSRGEAPYDREDLRWSLPTRDGAHAYHDSAHLGLPIYGVTPGGRVLLTVPEENGFQHRLGLEHRRESETHLLEASES